MSRGGYGVSFQFTQKVLNSGREKPERSTKTSGDFFRLAEHQD